MSPKKNTSEPVEGTDDQLSLLPEKRPAAEFMRVPLDALPPDSELFGEKPDAALVRSIRANGIQQPISLATDGVSYRVLAGTRRIKAARWIVAHPKRGDDIDDLRGIPALVTRVSDDVGSGLTLGLQATYKPNPARELRMIETLQARGFSIEKIAAETGFPIQTIKERLRLTKLIPEFRSLLDQGAITARLGKRIAALPPASQSRLFETVEDKSAITEEMVREARSAESSKAVADLFESLPVIEEPGPDTHVEPYTPADRADFMSTVAACLIEQSIVLHPSIDVLGIEDGSTLVKYPSGKTFRLTAEEVETVIEVGVQDGVPVATFKHVDPVVLETLAAESRRERLEEREREESFSEAMREQVADEESGYDGPPLPPRRRRRKVQA